MKRYKLGVLGMSEVRWKGQGDEVDDDGVRIIFSGGDKHERGVAIVLEKEVAKRIIEIEQCNDRLMMIKISTTPVDIAIIQVYMSTTTHKDDEIEIMYEQIEKLINKQKGNKNVVVM